MLSEQARRVLYVRCSNHTVAHCDRCDEEWFSEELEHDVEGSGGQGVLCRNCSANLTTTIQRHLFRCLLTWTHEQQVSSQKRRRELRDFAPGARAEYEALRQRSDVTDPGERGRKADDRRKLQPIPAAVDREAGSAGTKRAHGGAHGWLVLGAGFAVLLLSGIPVWRTALRPLSEAPGSLRSRSTDVPASPSVSRTAPGMDVQPAARVIVPYGTDGAATRGPRSHHVRGVGKPSRRSVVPTVRDQSVSRATDEQIQSP
jgi:hypothetical protein